ncbi:MAG: hypothetical protein KAI25_07955 [Hyphomicrobiaceae bacterium]|nr:hypothetical protein [Hyphomicrobiaceae bacterium]
MPQLTDAEIEGSHRESVREVFEKLEERAGRSDVTVGLLVKWIQRLRWALDEEQAEVPDG